MDSILKRLAAELLEFFIAVLSREHDTPTLACLEKRDQGSSCGLARFVHISGDIDDLELVEEVEVFLDKVRG